MTRKDLIQYLVDQNGMTLQDADWFVRAFFDALSQKLMEGQRVEFRGFGTFYTRTRQQAKFLNPKNGQLTPASCVQTVHFKAFADLLDEKYNQA